MCTFKVQAYNKIKMYNTPNVIKCKNEILIQLIKLGTSIKKSIPINEHLIVYV